MIKRQKFPSASVWLWLHPKHFAMYSKNSIVGTYISSIFCKNTTRNKKIKKCIVHLGAFPPRNT
jgi:hypothetical protein